jgi:putative hemolysin
VQDAPVNSTAEPPLPEAVALPVSTSTSYHIQLARGPGEIRAAQRLRFQVFNLELGEGLDASYATGLDQDRFDEVCDHLLVYHGASGELAGTYRLQSGPAAAAGHGYYSETEFDFGPLEPLRSRMIEIGRACVHESHRNPAVLGLLWRGIADYARRHCGQFLVGCSSLPTLDPGAGWAAYARLARAHLAPPGRRTQPRPGWECPAAGVPEIACPLPKLMQAYLSLGAEICGPPARDRQFGTIDFLTMLDLEALHPAAKRRFLS